MLRSLTDSPAFCLTAFLFLVFALFAHGYVENTDAEVEMQTARALVLRGSTGLSAGHPDASTAERLICTTPGAPVLQGVDGKHYGWFGIGHALTMIPFWVGGQGLGELLPETERTAASPGPGEVYREDFFARFVVSFHSPLFGALTALVLFALLGHLGFAVRERVVAVLLATLTTQFGPGTRENMSDIEAGFFLLFALERAFAWRAQGGRGRLAAAGALAGFAVLSRVPHVVPVVGMFGWLLFRCLRERRWAPIAAFVLGGLPWAVLLLWFNAARFGSPFATGYHRLENYWSFNFFFGFALLALSPGKGMLLFSPLLWLVPSGLRRLGREHAPEVLLCAFFLVGPWLVTSFTAGWHSSQAWGCRYLTPGVVLLVAVASAALLRYARDGGRSPWLLWGLGGLGLVFALGGWLAPYHGFYELANPAAAAKWPAPEVDPAHLFHYIVSDPRMSPLFGHWLYAWHSLTGAIPDGGPEVLESLFGVAGEGLSPRPAWPAATGFRHLWWIGLGDWLRSTVPVVLGLLHLLTTAAAAVLLWRTTRSR